MLALQTELPNLTVAIITHLADSMLQKAIESLLVQTALPSAIWIVHSNDQPLEKPFPWSSPKIPIHYHWMRANIGFAASVNWVFATATTSIFLLNDDVELHPDCIQLLSQAQHQYPTSMLQPSILDMNHPTLIENQGHALAMDGMNHAYKRHQKYDNQHRILPSMCISGAAMWIPFQIYQHPKLREMDTSLSPFGEDVDYSLRVIREGFTIQCVESAVIWHKWGGSYQRYSPQKVVWVEAHRIQLGFKNLPYWMLLFAPLATLRRYAQSMNDTRIPASKQGEAAWSALQGIGKGYRSIPSALEKRYQQKEGSLTQISDWEFTKRWWQQRKSK